MAAIFLRPGKKNKSNMFLLKCVKKQIKNGRLHKAAIKNAIAGAILFIAAS